MKDWIVYLTTCKANGMQYVGVHYGSPDSAYLGSGTVLKAAVRKYGRAAFERQTIRVCVDAEEAYELEELIVDQALLSSGHFYNLALGGRGARSRLTPEEVKAKMRKPKSIQTRQRMSEAKLGITTSQLHKEACRKAQTGRKHAPEVLEKMSQTRKGRTHETVTCPHCGKSGGAPAMGQWHFNNCKLKEKQHGN